MVMRLPSRRYYLYDAYDKKEIAQCWYRDLVDDVSLWHGAAESADRPANDTDPRARRPGMQFKPIPTSELPESVSPRAR